jgi:thymidine phosphorylase
LAQAAENDQDARTKLRSALEDGRALAKFGDWIEAQGGTRSIVNDNGVLPRATIIEDIPAPQSGYISGIDAERVGLAVVMLGGGRERKGEPIDHAVGVVLKHKVGDHVNRGEPLFTLHANDRSELKKAEAHLLQAFAFSGSPPEPPPLIHRIVT